MRWSVPSPPNRLSSPIGADQSDTGDNHINGLICKLQTVDTPEGVRAVRTGNQEHAVGIVRRDRVIGAISGVDGGIEAVAAVDVVVASAARERVVASSPVKGVVASVASQCVAASSPVKGVVAS